MPVPVREIPLLDLVSFLIETPETPTHVGSLQIYAPRGRRRRDGIVAALLEGLRAAEVGSPFDLVPLFTPLTWPRWARAESIDPLYHVRHVSAPPPGAGQQLIDLVMELHAPMLDRSRPGWICYVIDGLSEGRFALYWKVHHAYIDGASAVMRFEATAARSASDTTVRAPWSPLPGEADAESAREPPELPSLAAGWLRAGSRASRDLLGMFGRTLLQASGRLEREVPLPFSAPHSLFNAPVHATRRLGIGSTPLERFRAVAKAAGVSVNDVALAIVGEALERYAHTRHETPDRPLVAACPMSIRAPGDTSASTQIAAISVKLGEPGANIRTRLQQVHASTRDAKAEARGVSREGLIAWLALLGGTADLVSKSALAERIPPATNVNISNVAGPAYRCFLAGAELVASYPVSTLAGGTAINVTFASTSGRMDYAVVTDARAIPDPEEIAHGIGEALAALERALARKSTPKATRAKKPARGRGGRSPGG
jgi:WS/DGAT/MGAT family acyltransferase